MDLGWILIQLQFQLPGRASQSRGWMEGRRSYPRGSRRFQTRSTLQVLLVCCPERALSLLVSWGPWYYLLSCSVILQSSQQGVLALNLSRGSPSPSQLQVSPLNLFYCPLCNPLCPWNSQLPLLHQTEGWGALWGFLLTHPLSPIPGHF